MWRKKEGGKCERCMGRVEGRPHTDKEVGPSSLAPPPALCPPALPAAAPSGPRKLSPHDFSDVPTEPDPDRLMNPPAVIKIIRSSLKVYIPLIALINYACRSMHRLVHHRKETLKVENGAVTISLPYPRCLSRAIPICCRVSTGISMLSLPHPCSPSRRGPASIGGRIRSSLQPYHQLF